MKFQARIAQTGAAAVAAASAIGVALAPAAIADPPANYAANWTETQKISATKRLVHAHVISGSCGDNTWNVTFEPTSSLTGVDTMRSDTTFSFTPA